MRLCARSDAGRESFAGITIPVIVCDEWADKMVKGLFLLLVNGKLVFFWGANEVQFSVVLSKA